MCTPDPSDGRKPLRVRGSHSNTVHKRPLLITVSACHICWAYLSQVLELEAATLADMLAIYLPTEMHGCTRWIRGGRRNADCQLDHAASGCALLVFFLSLLRHMATMDTLAALGRSICATGAVQHQFTR